KIFCFGVGIIFTGTVFFIFLGGISGNVEAIKAFSIFAVSAYGIAVSFLLYEHRNGIQRKKNLLLILMGIVGVTLFSLWILGVIPDAGGGQEEKITSILPNRAFFSFYKG